MESQETSTKPGRQELTLDRLLLSYTHLSFLFMQTAKAGFSCFFLCIGIYSKKKRKAMSAYLVFFFFRLHLNVKRCKSFDGIK